MSEEIVPLLRSQEDEEEEFLLRQALAIRITNLPTDVEDTETALKDFFSFCGVITQFTITENEAVIAFQSPDAAKSAVLLTGATLGNQKLNVEAVPASATQLQQHQQEQVSLANSSAPPKTQTSIVDELLAKGYELTEHARQQAVDYDQQYQITLTAHSLAQQMEEKTKELDQQYNLTEVAENTFENFGKKIQEVDQQYHIGESLNQMIAAAVNTGELARDVIVAKSSETSTAVHTGTADIRSQGEAITMSAISSAAEALESLNLQEKGEAVVSSITNFVETNETAQATLTSLQQWAAALQQQFSGQPESQ